MKKIAFLILLALLVCSTAPAQRRDSDPDVPVLKRRPAPEPTDHDPEPASSSASAQPAEPEPEAEPEPAPPPRPALDALGFDADATQTRCTLTRSGGVIRVTVADPDDVDLVGQIGLRLSDMASRFRRGEFSRSDAASASALREVRGRVTYTAHPIEDGAELIISGQDQRAISAIQRYLQSQLRPAALRR